MPWAVLAHALPFDLPDGTAGLDSAELEAILRASNEDLATLAPGSRFFVAAQSGHDIHQDQPELVAEALRQVVTAVREPDTWDSLASCCVPAAP